ncbi:ribonuclease E [Brevibacterium sanguinis]|uniref:Ribonuclease E n=2 Tax=Brevibacterium TaxID=1696 RepID=A0A366IIG5_9MICO|nr:MULTISPECIES: Rne/Rng family ribonuclease [Brevibacterium]RBP64291.1 ribonuclease E [Brevibacterium sanguinis]RBP71417.1 ribonuclease E [Brevibacterium celere]
MNDSPNDGTDPTEGILADLANLQEAAAASDRSQDRDVESIQERLERIAEAAESLREPERGTEDDSEDRSTPSGNRPAPRKASSAVANRGLVFEQFVRDTADDDLEDDDPEDVDDDDVENDDSDDADETPTVAFDPRNPFTVQPVQPPAPRPAAAVPPAGGLIFQVPKAELAEVVEVEDDDYDDDEPDSRRDSGAEDRESSDRADDRDSEDSETGDGGRRRRRGGRGRRSRGRDENGGDENGRDEDTGDAESSDAADSPAEESERGGRGRRRSDRKSGADRDGGGRDKGDREGTDKADRGATPESDDSAEGADPDTDDGDEDENGSRRRRRRRSRTRTSETDEVTSLKGSTRLEAKRQRRKEGREAGRRRPVITEAEFLARRESVERTMLVRESGNQTQLVVVEDGIAVEHYLKENRQQSSLIGNVYLGKVQNVLPSMEAAFIDIGKGRNAVLYAGEVNWDALGMEGKARRIELALSPGDAVLVQVTKDPVGHKGARLTSQISLPGRFLVYVPGNSMTGISRKLPDVERNRLKKLLKDLVGDSAGVIVRTAAEGASDKELGRDVERLAKRWETIEKKSKSTKVLAPQLLYSEPDMIVRIIRDVFNEDFTSLVIDGDGAWTTIHEYVEAVAPDLLDRVHRYSEDEDIFDHYRVEEQIQKALSRTVNLPSGGSLVIDRTEAMTVIDVNTGKFTGAGGNLEETVTRNNLEAAEEVIRQLRLRDIGGIIVVDFIDMVLESNRDLVVRRLVECLGRDRTKHQVAEVTSLGLVQMTRKRIGTGLAESLVAAGHDLSGRGLLLPGSEEDGSKAGFGSGSGNGGGGGRRDRKRRNDSSSAKKSDSDSDVVTVDASRSAVAAIAKATLKKDEDVEQPQAGEATAGGRGDSAGRGDSDGKSGSGDKDDSAPKEQSKRSKGRRRSNRAKSGSEDSGAGSSAQPSEGESTTETSRTPEQASAQPAAKESAPAQKPAQPAAEPAADMPLMIGADATTKVAVAEPVSRPRRRKSESSPQPEPAKQTLPSSFVIIGED